MSSLRPTTPSLRLLSCWESPPWSHSSRQGRLFRAELCGCVFLFAYSVRFWRPTTVEELLYMGMCVRAVCRVFVFFRVLPRMAAALMAKLLGLSGQQRKMHGRHTTAVSRRLTARVSEPVKTNRQSCTSPSPSQAHTTDGCSSSAHPFHNTPPRRNHRPTEGGEVRKSSARKRKQTGPLKAEPRR